MSEGGMMEGDYRRYFKNGQIAVQGNFKNLQPWNGHFIRYREDGTIISDQVYKDGLLLNDQGTPLTGVVEVDLGDMREESTYRDGRLHGLNKTYYDNGMLKSETEWKNGKMDGYSRYYERNGALRAQFQFKDGQMRNQKNEGSEQTE